MAARTWGGRQATSACGTARGNAPDGASCVNTHETTRGGAGRRHRSGARNASGVTARPEHVFAPRHGVGA